MSQRGSVIFRVIGSVILLAVLASGVFIAFQAGQAQGYALGAAAGVTDKAGTAVQQLPPAAFYPGMMGHHFFHPFMGFFGIFPLLIGLMFVFGIFRHLVFGYPHRGYCRCSGKFHRHPYWDFDRDEEDTPGTAKPADEQPKA
jgi:hypothetical protein